MAVIIEDRIRETSASTGTATFVLSGAVLAHRTFSSVCNIGDTFYGMIVAVDANGFPTGQWESGNYTYSAANTITRTAVNANNLNSAALINFTAGTKHVYLDVTAAQVKLFQTSGTSSSVLPFGLPASQFTNLIFQDEFNGNVLDSTKWNPNFYLDTNDPLQNFSVANGNLNIWPDTGFINRTIDSDGKFYFTPGCYVEIETKMNIGKGTTPALWLHGHDTLKPIITIGKCFPGGTPTAGTPPGTGWATAAFHPNDYLFDVQSDAGITVASMRASSFITVPDLSLAFNKWGVRWETSGITFYFNGVQMGAKVATTALSNRMYVLLSIWMDTAPDTPDNTNTPRGIANAMQVNYVRGWQLA